MVGTYFRIDDKMTWARIRLICRLVRAEGDGVKLPPVRKWEGAEGYSRGSVKYYARQMKRYHVGSFDMRDRWWVKKELREFARENGVNFRLYFAQRGRMHVMHEGDGQGAVFEPSRQKSRRKTDDDSENGG